MRRTIAGAMIALCGIAPHAQQPRAKGVSLTNLTWIEAERALDPTAIVIVPIGAALVQHGPHLKLNNDERLVRYLQSRLEASSAVVGAAPITYHYLPSFNEYPGSTTLTLTTARDATVEIVRSLARYGPKRFYALTIADETARPLEAAARVLADDGILLHYTDADARLAGAARSIAQQQPAPGHADELETSMMLYIDPQSVDMTKAIREVNPRPTRRLTRTRNPQATFSETGIVGDPTFATADKGGMLVEALVRSMSDDIERLRAAPLPPVRSAGTPAAAPARRTATGESPAPNGCTGGVERTIRDVATRFSTYWRQMDPERIAELFTESGDIRHPDGTIERGQDAIRQNRLELFKQRQYRGSIHPVALNDIRCLAPTIALADGKWELRLADVPGTGRPDGSQKIFSGWCSLVLTGGGSRWAIEAWRYTVDPPDGTPPPTTLKQPGFIGRHQDGFR